MARENAKLKRELDMVRAQLALLEHILGRVLALAADTASAPDDSRPGP